MFCNINIQKCIIILKYSLNFAILNNYIGAYIKVYFMWQEMTNGSILKTLGERIKEYRIRRNMQQTELAEQAGVNISTIVRMEKGSNVMIDSYIRVLRVLDMLDNLDEFIPEPPRSPLLMKKLMGKKKQRIKKTKEDHE